MKLSELKELLNRPEVFDFDDEQVIVEFRTKAGIELTPSKASFCLSVSEKDAKPILKIELTVTAMAYADR